MANVSKSASKSAKAVKPSTIFDLAKLDTAQLVAMHFFMIPQFSNTKDPSVLDDAVVAELNKRVVTRPVLEMPQLIKLMGGVKKANEVLESGSANTLRTVDFQKMPYDVTDSLGLCLFNDGANEPTPEMDLALEMYPFSDVAEIYSSLVWFNTSPNTRERMTKRR